MLLPILSLLKGWLQNGRAWGRPVDLEHMPDGSILISDDFANCVYRIWYRVIKTIRI